MPPPFPGTNPWPVVGKTFPNFHKRLLISKRDALNEALPPGYVATSKNRVRVNDELPLDAGAPPVPLDLRATFDRCYDDGPRPDLARHDRKQPDPPLSHEQPARAEGVLRAKGVIA